MRYSMIAAALVGAVAAMPAYAPPAYGAEESAASPPVYGGEGSWGTSTTDQTTVVTITSCGAEVTDCPASSAQTIPPPVSTENSPVGGSAPAPAPPAYTPATTLPLPVTTALPTAPATTAPVSTENSPVGGSAPAYSPESSIENSPVGGSSPAAPPAYAPETTSAPAVSAPATSAPASTENSPVGGSAPAAPPAYTPSAPVVPSASAVPSSPAAPIYPVPGNGTVPGASGTGSPSASGTGAPSASGQWPVQQTGNTAAGIKAGSFIAGAGALAALFL